MARKKKRTESQEARRFGVILTIILLALASLSLWRHHTGRATGLIAGSVVVLVLSLVALSLWVRVFRLWMKFAEALSWVMTRVLLILFFYVILTPVGIVMRLLGKAPLDLRWRDGKPTYWIDKPEVEYSIERYMKQF
jgi:uncharacterized protein YybS (DUF2232 family)